jgi:sulfur carrier protein
VPKCLGCAVPSAWYDLPNDDSAQRRSAQNQRAAQQQLEIDARRVAVELNTAVVKKAAYDSSVIKDGDEVEIVNFVGGG